MRLVLIAALGIFALPTAPSYALTNDQTCAQAQRDYERNGRVNTRTRSGKVLPIYGNLPASKRNQLSCSRNAVVITRTVVTRDDRRCVISVRCG